MNYYGKKTSRSTKGGVIQGKKNSFKKAIVELVDGNNIDFYSNE
jgi:large subunit ribosomal protein L23